MAVDGNLAGGAVARYDAASGGRTDSLDMLACALASGDGVVWAAGCPFADRLSTDEQPLRRLRHIPLPFQPPGTASTTRVQFREMAVGAGSLWVLGDALDRRVWRLDPRRGTIQATIALPFPPRSVVVSEGEAWITDGLHVESTEFLMTVLSNVGQELMVDYMKNTEAAGELPFYLPGVYDEILESGTTRGAGAPKAKASR